MRRERGCDMPFKKAKPGHCDAPPKCGVDIRLRSYDAARNSRNKRRGGNGYNRFSIVHPVQLGRYLDDQQHWK